MKPATSDGLQDATRRSRTDIGFLPRREWRDAEPAFGEHTLTIQGHPVMEDWEDGYMRALARIACSQGGIVLEVGFGMGLSARHIQEHSPKLHVIIEANRRVFERALDFAALAPSPVQPLFGFWEDITQSLIPSGSLSGILFDTYPLREEEIHRNHFPFFKEAHRMLRQGGVLTYYSDEASDFSHEHLRALRNAGFSDIRRDLCAVSPPRDCAYWKSGTIVAPTILK